MAHTGNEAEIRVGSNTAGGWDIKICGKRHAVDNRIVTNGAAVADSAVEKHAVEAYKNAVSHLTGAMHDGSMGNRAVLTNRDGSSILGVHDDAILNVGSFANENGVKIALIIRFVRSNDGVGADKDMATYDDFATDDSGRVDRSEEHTSELQSPA